jgi:hypothetical protein
LGEGVAEGAFASIWKEWSEGGDYNPGKLCLYYLVGGIMPGTRVVMMFQYLRVKRQVEKIVPDTGALTKEQLTQDPGIPITLHQINMLPENAKRRVYRGLLPPELLDCYGIDPIKWSDVNGKSAIQLVAEAETGSLKIWVSNNGEIEDPFICIELSDNSFNGIDLNMLLLNDPDSPTFRTDIDETGRPTLFGTARRNLAEELRAMQAGLAPAQVRKSLGASRLVLQHLEVFFSILGHRAYFLEPLTYASAWVFERRGFAYARGHKLMDDIHKEFQPGGQLNRALDGSTPFRQPGQWRTVRGRAWAIQDGILDVIDQKWDKLRMVKQIGSHAGVETFPGAVY